MFRPDALLFDLDGTLADTRDDIAGSLNHVLRAMGRPEKRIDEVTAFIGDGVRTLLARALGPSSDAVIDEAVARFKPHYETHCADHARLYPGAAEALDHFKRRGLAVVTNKPQAATGLLLERLGVADFFPVILGGDALPVKKPSPEPLLEAARRLSIPPERAVMVGDSPGDVRAGRAAGMRTCAVTYGYRPASVLREERPDDIISSLEELKEVLS